VSPLSQSEVASQNAPKAAKASQLAVALAERLRQTLGLTQSLSCRQAPPCVELAWQVFLPVVAARHTSPSAQGTAPVLALPMLHSCPRASTSVQRSRTQA